MGTNISNSTEQDPDSDFGFDEPEPDNEGDDSILASRYENT